MVARLFEPSCLPSVRFGERNGLMSFRLDCLIGYERPRAWSLWTMWMQPFVIGLLCAKFTYGSASCSPAPGRSRDGCATRRAHRHAAWRVPIAFACRCVRGNGGSGSQTLTRRTHPPTPTSPHSPAAPNPWLDPLSRPSSSDEASVHDTPYLAALRPVH